MTRPNRRRRLPPRCWTRLPRLEDRTLPASVGSFVWLDENFNGLREPGEPGVAGVVVQLNWAGLDGTPGTADDLVIARQITKADGKYFFSDLPAAADYYVSFRTSSEYQYTLLNAGPSDIDSDVTPTGRTVAFGLKAGETNLALDAGLIRLFDAPAFGQAFALDSAFAESARAVAVDSEGFYLLAGEFQGPTDFDPGPGQSVRDTQGGSDVFVAKYTRDGALVWVAVAGGKFDDAASAIAVDAAGGLAVVGTFSGSVDFDPGPGTFPLFAKGVATFIWRLDPDGRFNWAKAITGGTSNVLSNAVAFDAAANLYVGGEFFGVVDFDPGTGFKLIGSDSLTFDGFLLKLDPAGNFGYVGVIGGPNSGDTVIRDLAVTGGGRVFAGGDFVNFADLDPGPGIFPAKGNSGDTGFVLEVNPDGSFRNAFVVGVGSGESRLTSLAVAPGASGPGAFDIYAGGSFFGILDFDPGSKGTNLLTSGSMSDPFAVKFNNTGDGFWASSASGEGQGTVEALALDADSRLYLTGQFNGFIDFDPVDGGDFFVSADGPRSGFLWQLDDNGLFVSARAFGSGAVVQPTDLAFLPGGELIVVGEFQGSGDFDPGVGVFPVGSNQFSRDAFVWRLKPNSWVTGSAWFDTNGDGIRELNDPPMSGITLAARFVGEDGKPGTGDDTTVGTAVVNPDGFYLIENVPTNESPYLLFSAVPGYEFTLLLGSDTGNSRVNPVTQQTDSITARPFEIVRFMDAGYRTAKAPAFGFANRLGSTGEDLARSVASDAKGNVFTAGSFFGELQADPGVGSVTLETGDNPSMFITRHGPNGELAWAKAAIAFGESSVSPGAIVLETGGGVLIAGNFVGSVNFNPAGSPVVFTTTASLQSEPFLLRLDADGNFVSVNVWGNSAGTIRLSDMAAVPGGGVVIVGDFTGSPDFDPGGSSASLSTSDVAAFVLRLDGGDNFVRADALGNGATAFGRAVAVDAFGAAHVAGAFVGTGDFDPGTGQTLLSSIAPAAFVAALKADGTLSHAKAIAPTTELGSVLANDIVVTPNGSAMVVGQYAGTADFDPGAAIDPRTASGPADWFAVRLDLTGNRLWAATTGGPQFVSATAAALADDGGLYVAGLFELTADFNPGIGKFELTSGGGRDGFVVKLSASNGSYQSARRFGGSGDDAISALAMAPSGDLLIAGQFADVIDFDPTDALFLQVSAGDGDAFTYRLASSFFAPLDTGTVVTTTFDSGPGSLRQAILNANANPGLDTIGFDIGPGLVVPTIFLSSPLPAITDAVVIDGLTQPGSGTKPRVAVSGAFLPTGSFAPGLQFDAGKSVVRGLVIQNFNEGPGILVGGFGSADVADVVIEFVYVGTDATGSMAEGNETGIRIDNGAAGTVIRNSVVSGNRSYGVKFFGQAKNSVIDRSFIGVSADGLKALPNGFAGVGISGLASGNLLARNVISANGANNVLLAAAGIGNVIQGNFIGTDVTGLSLPDGKAFTDSAGVAVTDTPGVKVIGNTIAGTTSVGVAIGSGAAGTSVIGNFIGTDSVGKKPLGHPIGVLVHGGAVQTTLADNLISGNKIGVLVTGTMTADTTLTGNRIGTDAAGTQVIANGEGVRIVSATRTRLQAANVFAQASGPAVAVREGAVETVISGGFLGVASDGKTLLPGGSSSVAAITIDGATGTDVAANVIRGFAHAVRLDQANQTVIESNNIAGMTGDGVIVSASKMIRLFNNSIIDGQGAGVRFNAASDGVVGRDGGGNTIRGNLFGGVVVGGGSTSVRVEGNLIESPSVGVAVEGETFGVAVVGNVIQGGAFGIDLAGTFAPVISQNRILATKTAAVNANSVSLLSLFDNVIVGNFGNGAVVNASTGPRIFGNRIGSEKDGSSNGNAGFGLVLGLGTTAADVGGSGIENANVVANNNSGGISLTFTKGVTLTNNRVAANGGTAILLSGSDSTTLVGNEVVGNADGVRVAGGSSGTTLFGNFIGIGKGGHRTATSAAA